MASRFGTIPTINYVGIPQGMPTGICAPSVQTPKMVTLQIDWNIPWQALGNVSSVGVTVDLKGQVPSGAQLDKIRSIKIDNTFSTCPMYAYFPDTGDVITCAPQTVVTLPVNTNAHSVVIYAQNLSAGFIPYTVIYLFNVALPASIDPAIQTVYPQYLGSPTIQRANLLTPGFGAPALGDQFTQAIVNVNTLNQTANLFGSPNAAGGFYYITALSVYLIPTAVPANSAADVVIEGSISGTLLDVPFQISSGATGVNTLFQMFGTQIKLSALETWRIRNTILVGYSARVSCVMCYSYNAN